MTDQKIKDYEVVFKKINHLKDIRQRYINGNNLDVFLEEYGLSSSIASIPLSNRLKIRNATVMQ